MAFMIKVFLGLSQAHKAVSNLFPAFLIGLTKALPLPLPPFSWNICGLTPATLALAGSRSLSLMPSSSLAQV